MVTAGPYAPFPIWPYVLSPQQRTVPFVEPRHVKYIPAENNLPDWIIEDVALFGTSERLAFVAEGTTRPAKQPINATARNFRRDVDIECEFTREFCPAQGGAQARR